jgi:hypothetical protein
MQVLSHADQLRRFRDIISPIANALGEVLKTPSDALSGSDHQVDSVSSMQNAGGDSSLPHESSEFFNDARQEADTKPMGLPLDAHGSEIKQTGRLFEYLRQKVLQRSAKEFNQLPIQIQALARMGGLIYTERENFQQRVYHLLANGKPLGVLDRRKGHFYVRQEIPQVDLTDLHCVMRPHGANELSHDMALMPVQDAVWLYGAHDPEALLDLPAEMGIHWLRLRKLPNVSPHLMQDRHLALIRILLVRDKLFDQLLRNSSKNDHVHLLRDLASMLLTRAIEISPDTTTTPQRDERLYKFL